MAWKMLTMCPLGTRIRSGALMSPDQCAGFNVPAAVYTGGTALEFPKPRHECTPPSSSGAEPGFGTMSSNQGAGRGRLGGSLSPDHCLTHQTQWRAEWRARQGGGAAGDNNGILHSNLPSINHTLLKNGNPFIEKCWAHSTH